MEEKLFAEFPPVSTPTWEAQIQKDLKGADYDKKLVWKTMEGFAVRPYYRSSDLKGVLYMPPPPPGSFPYMRGIKQDNNWQIHQTFETDSSLAEANRQALSALEYGVDSVGFHTTVSLTLPQLQVLLKDIYLPAVMVTFEGDGCITPDMLDAFLHYTDQMGVAPADVHARFDCDPLSRFTLDGKVDTKAFDHIAQAVRLAFNYPDVRVFTVSGYTFHCLGASIAQELGFICAVEYEYIRLMMERQLSPEEVVKASWVKSAVGSSYFMEIAKFRALRVSVASIFNDMFSDTDTDSNIWVRAVTSPWNQTVYDRHVNLLRGTTEAMSAALAGVDSLEVLPFDAPLGNPNEFSRRLARNIQLILKEEAHFDKVVDPAGGSYYIDSLTNSLGVVGYQLYKECLDFEGYINYYQHGRVLKPIHETLERRKKNLATRRDVLLGVNQYPNFTEKAPEGLTEEILNRTLRGAAPFEAMRLRTEQSGLCPKAFMLTFGNLGMCRARAQFSSNFFAVAGIEVIDNNRFATLEEGVAAALASHAQLVVACSSDDEYAEAVPRINALLEGRALLVVAGDPACKDALMAQGITHFISIRTNVLDTLLQYQNELGI